MKLADLLKTALDEVRMQMLGAQVLLGFQFQGLFQDGFETVPPVAREVDGVGLALMVIVLGALISVPSQHRIAEHGEATERIFRAARRYATIALLPLAGAVGCDVFVALSRSFPLQTGAALSTLAFVLAVAAWYGAGILLKHRIAGHGVDRAMKKEPTPLHTKIDQMLTEARVILPGAQALLGFQLVIMMTKMFDRVPPPVRVVHLAATLCTATAIILLITPAAIHRIAFDGRDDPRMHTVGSILITVALIPLAAGVSCDLFVALTRLFGEGRLAITAALLTFGLLMGLWYVLPFALRRQPVTVS
jgi:hypothetical protein